MEYMIRPAKNGFTLGVEDENYNTDVYVFSTWNDLIAYITDKEVK